MKPRSDGMSGQVRGRKGLFVEGDPRKNHDQEEKAKRQRGKAGTDEKALESWVCLGLGGNGASDILLGIGGDRPPSPQTRETEKNSEIGEKRKKI